MNKVLLTLLFRKILTLPPISNIPQTEAGIKKGLTRVPESASWVKPTTKGKEEASPSLAD